ncbi:MAG TPA: tetratricopeptide repeat protein [Candidatus Koribacter sp.]|jgi:Flp pilus assembly protein TadD
MQEGTQAQGEQRRWLPELVTALVAIAVYARSFEFDFAFDDVAIIVHNITVHSWRFLPDYFTRDLWQNVQPNTGYYRPLVLLWFRVNDALFGLHPVWWHLTSVLAHTLASVLVLRLAMRLTGNQKLSWIAGLLFAVHPVHVETVSWISDVVDALLTAWFVGGMLCFLRWRATRRAAWLAASLLCYSGAMLTKEPGFVLPAVLFLYVLMMETEPLGARVKNAFIAILAYIPLAVIYLFARHHAIRGFSVQLQPMSDISILLTIPTVLWAYLRSLLLPFGLGPFYDLPRVTAAAWQTFFSPLIGVLAVAALVCLVARKASGATTRFVAFAIAWSVVTIAPALDLPAFPPSEMVHDRYIYLASVGFCLLAAAVLGHLETRTAALATVAIVLALGALSFRQQGFWRDDITMFSRGVEISPHNDNAEAGLATLVARKGDYPLAISLYRDVLKRNPTQMNANLNLGWTYVLLGDYANAEPFLTTAATHYTNSPDPFIYLGVLYSETNRLDLALASLRRAEALSVPRASIHEQISEVLERKGDIAGAIGEMETALQIAPNDPRLATRLRELQSRSTR